MSSGNTCIIVFSDLFRWGFLSGTMEKLSFLYTDIASFIVDDTTGTQLARSFCFLGVILIPHNKSDTNHSWVTMSSYMQKSVDSFDLLFARLTVAESGRAS